MDHELNALGQPVGLPVAGWSPPPRPQREALTGRFCRVEPLSPDLHAADLHAANKHDATGRMWTYLSYGPFASLAEYRSWMQGVCAGEDPLFFAIVDLQSGRAVGVATYMRIDPGNGCMEVGHLAYSPLLQRTPAATEAMFLMMQQAFALGYRRYEWKCHSLNAASRRAAQRLGFSFEGVFRQAVVARGRNRDTAWFSVIDSEWPALDRMYRRWLAPANFEAGGEQRERLSDLTDPLLVRRDQG